jgi:hypothetical protein
LTQRKTQTAAYWQNQFTVSGKEIEALYNQILETNSLVCFDDIAISLVRRKCEAEELATRTDLQRGELYQPQDSYVVGDKIIFPALEFALGTVESSRSGNHPQYGHFIVLKVLLEGQPQPREFVAGFSHAEALNIGAEQSLASLQGLMLPEELYQLYHEPIEAKIRTALNANPDFVEFQDQYYLRDLMIDVPEGLFNIADAAIDINGGPLSADALIEQMGLNKSDLNDTLRFSVNYHLENDPRFDDVGPTGQVRWYLERLEPPEVHHFPRRLQANGRPYKSDRFDDAFLTILAEIDDETTNPEDIPATPEHAKSITVVLNYPHWRVGTLPLTPKTRSFFPSSSYNPVMFHFVDGRTGDTFPGWTVSGGSYVFGLDNWYKKNKLPVGAYLTIKRTDDPMRVIVDFQATRAQRDWIRVVTVAGHRLSFQMNTQAITCKYDELMIVADANPTAVDRLWLDAEERNTALFDILCNIFPELSKLNPQSTVHFKTLYSAANIIRRFSPGLIYEELHKHSCFIPMNHDYWTYDASLRDE